MTIRTLHHNRRMRRTLLGCLLLAAALLAAATAAARSANPSPLTPKLARALAVGGLAGSTRAAVAVDLQTGEILYKQRRFVGMEPASNEKLPVTFAALHVLGGTYRIPTDVLGNGGQVGKTWRGNLVLRGRGDPTLSYRDLKHMAWMVRGLGIRRITGSIVGDESFFDSKRGVWGWKSYFYGGESPALSALTVDRCIFKGQLSSRPALAAAALFKQALKGAGVTVAGKSKQGVARRSRPSRSRTSLPRRSGRSSGTWTAGATTSPPSSSSSSSARRRGTARPPAEPRSCGRF